MPLCRDAGHECLRDPEWRIARADLDRVLGADIHRDRIADRDSGSDRDALSHSKPDRRRGVPDGNRDKRDPFARLGDDIASADRRR